MKWTSALACLSLALPALAAPARLQPRQINDNGTAAVGSSITDTDILQFALTLEYLEISLYEIGVTTFSDADFTNAGYAGLHARFEEIINQELQHIAMLRSTVKMLGSTPNQPCTYDFGTIPNVQAFLNMTDVVNGLGPSAYLGAGAFVKDKMVLTVGSSIGNVETQHNSWLSEAIGRDAFPNAYFVPLSPTQSYGVGSQFIASCPSSNAPLNAVTAYPPSLKITNKGAPGAPLYAGSTLYLQPGAKFSAPSGGARAAFLYSLNTTIVDYDASSKSATIPSDAAGQIYVVLTTAQQGEVLNAANSLTVPQAFFVDVPTSRFADYDYQQESY